jgi:MFS family permease
MAGAVFFTTASLLCGLAWSPAALLAARVVQGAGAAIMTPTALSIISTTFTEGSERNKALGIWGALGGIGATTAWLIGGPLVDGPGWRWIFFINVPIGLATLALSPVLLRESRAALTRRSYDLAGALTITGALVLLVYAVVEAPGAGWGGVRTILPLAGSAMLVAALALIESRHPAPLVPLRIFRSRTLAGADALAILIGTVAVGKAGFRPAAATGLALMATGSLVLTRVSIHPSYFPDIFVGLLLCGLGIGLAFVTATVAALAWVAEHEAGLASGPSDTALQTGTALGVAIVTTVAVSRSQHLRRAGRDRPGAGVPARRPAAEASARAARAGPGGRCRCRCRRRRGDQVRNEMSEQGTDSYHSRRLRRR